MLKVFPALLVIGRDSVFTSMNFAYRVKRALLRALVALAVGALFILLPLPLGPWKRYQLVKDGIVAFILISYLGKLLYDTLVYDRYRP